MTAPGIRFFPDILEEHFEELPFLWDQRRAALRSPEYTLAGLHDLERRIEAHARGLLNAGDLVVPLLEGGLAETDPSVVFASAYLALRLAHRGLADAALALLRETEDEDVLLGLREAFCQGPLEPARDELFRLSGAERAAIAATAAEALAFHGSARPEPERLETFLDDPNPTVRLAGWRLVAMLGNQVGPKRYAGAMRDDDPDVRAAALVAGVWCRVEGVVAYGRKAAEAPSPDEMTALRLLAILGGTGDLPRIRELGRAAELGPDRFGLVGSYGHPALVDDLLVALRDEDPETAAAAGGAFTKMTGVPVEGPSTAQVPLDEPAEGAEPDAFEIEFVDDVPIPDADLAEREWARLRQALGASERICRGVDAARIDERAFSALDLESRREVCLRRHFQRAWNGSPIPLEVFPQGERPGHAGR